MDSYEQRVLHAELLGSHSALHSCSRLLLNSQVVDALYEIGKPPMLCFVGEKKDLQLPE